MATYVLIHGAWHDGSLMEPVAAPIRSAGHVVHAPTIAGNGPEDAKDTGLEAAIASIADYLRRERLEDVILVGHSYGGMVITGVADRAPAGAIRRLVYWSAFVPDDGEALNDLVPQRMVALFDEMCRADGTVLPPFPLWREVFTNDMSEADSKAAYARLNRQPYATFTDAIRLSRPPAAMEIGKSYINFTDDATMPHSMPWHPRLSEKLGLFRLVQAPGGHEVCFSNPALAAEKIQEAGRD